MDNIPRKLITKKLLEQCAANIPYMMIPADLRNPRLDELAVVSQKCPLTIMENYLLASYRTLAMTLKVMESFDTDIWLNSVDMAELVHKIPPDHMLDDRVMIKVIKFLLFGGTAGLLYQIAQPKWLEDIDVACAERCPECIPASRLTDDLSRRMRIWRYDQMTEAVKAERESEFEEYKRGTSEYDDDLLECDDFPTNTDLETGKNFRGYY